MEHTAKTKTMDQTELRAVLSWASDEGWNPGISDAEAFHAADPQGFFLTSIDRTPVAAISVVNHDAENAFLGLYICRPEWRAQGLGMATWQKALEHAGTRSIGLDGVPDQESNYRVSGFVKTGSSLRNEGRITGKPSRDVRPAMASDTEGLIRLDALANGFARPNFMTAWLTEVPQKRATRVLERDGEICGFATWRACQTGTKIGPVVASDTSSALELIADIAELRPEGPLIIDVPDQNTELLREFEIAGFTIPFVTARMYRGAVPVTGNSLQAIATMELG